MKPKFACALPSAPNHRRESHRIETFGTWRDDPYRWMKPPDWQSVLRDPESLDGEIRRAIDDENAYTEAFMSVSASLILQLENELSAIQGTLDNERGVPFGAFFYFERVSGVGDAVFGRRCKDTGTETVLLDMGQERETKSCARLAWGSPKVSPDQALFGWAIDETGSGIFSVKARHIDSGRVVVDDVHNCHGGFAFDRNGTHLFWVRRDEKGRPASVWRRDINSGTDTRCFENLDTAYFIDLKTSASGEYIFIRLLNGDQSEVWFVPSDTPTAAPILIEPRSPLHDYDVEHWQGRFVIRTNADNAHDYKIVTAPIETPGSESWDTLVPHISGRFINHIVPFANHLVRSEWRDARPHLVIMAADGVETDVSVDEAAYSLSLTPNQDYWSAFASYTYSSPASPPKHMRIALADAKVSSSVDGTAKRAFDSDLYRVERLDIIADDGAAIPVTLLSRTSSRPSPDQPLYLYAYGAYGECTEATFRPEAIALADRGWTYAIAHVRGGGERGSDWWRSTLKLGKKTTFSDFTTCAETLISMGRAGQGRIVAHGMSAGGLLMGSVFATHPHLWAGVIAQVPFVDILNTLDDWENHPLGSTPFAIWGDPRVEDEYRYMASYSPYDQLKPAEYPALLATGGVADDRVAFWEPLKFAAKARHLNTGSAPILAQIGLQSGHLGDPSPEGQLRQSALFLAFAISAVGQ